MFDTVREIGARIRAFATRGTLDREFEQELDTHLSLLIEENIRRGMTPEQAMRSARIRLGGAASLAEQHRAVRALPSLDAIWLDLRFAFRLIARNRWFSAAAVATIALGIAANAVGFTIINAALLRNLPFDESDRLYTMSWQNRSGRRSNVSAGEFEEWRTLARSFDGLAAYAEETVNLSDGRALPEQAQGVRVTGNVFAVLRQPPLLGRDFLTTDEQTGSAPVAIISYALWRNRYREDPNVLGTSVRVNGTATAIVGVMPAGMQFPDRADLWMPVVQPNARSLRVFGRLRHGIDRRAAHAELSGIARQQLTADPAGKKDLIGVRVETFSERFIGGAGRPLVLTVMAAAIFVLLIACANVANMLLSRSTYRAREIAARAAVGATRGRIFRQLVVESLVLAGIGGVLGLAVASAGVRIFAAVMTDSGFPSWVVFSVDYVVIGYVVVICVATVLLFGLAPALHLSKTSIDLLFKESGRAELGNRGQRWVSGTLIVGQLAVTVILLAGSGVMLRSFMTLYQVDIGVDTSRLSTMTLQLPRSKYPDGSARRTFWERLEPTVTSLPGVEAAAITTGVPSRDGGERLVEVEGATHMAVPVFVSTVVTTPRFFDAAGVAMVRGRNFTNTDGAPGAEAIIVNEVGAARFFPGQDAVGKRLRFTERGVAPGASTDAWRTIVGISGRILHGSSLDRYENAVVYIPLRQEAPATASLLVRSPQPPAAVMDAVRREVQRIDADQPVLTIQTLAQLLSRDRWWYRTWGGLFAILAAMAVLLSTVGLYAVLAYAVTQRTQEIGLRMAVGAQPRQVCWLILKRGLAHLALGVTAGLAGTLGLNQVLRFGLTEVGPTDPAMLAMIIALVAIVSIAACLVPVRRAIRIDPVSALRAE
jgi:predicted permease